MLLLPTVLFASTIAAAALPQTTTFSAKACTNPAKRVAWHTMNDTDKAAYLKAAKCLFTSPSKAKLPGAKTRWDDLGSLHQLHAGQIHSTGPFLPWHRYFLHVHETLMRNECGYKGPMAYWDEPLDAGHFSTSVVFHPTLGFGGDGQGPDNCVADGPFANEIVNIGPGYHLTPQCVNRKITDFLSAGTSQADVDAALKPTTFYDMQTAVYLGPHAMGHAGTAMMGPRGPEPIVSAGDPIFMLHHAFVDKMWADWQSVSSDRMTAIGGPNTQDPNVGFIEMPGNVAEEAVTFGTPSALMKSLTPSPGAGDGGSTTTLKHVLSSLDIMGSVQIRDIMDTKGGYLCYEYV